MRRRRVLAFLVTLVVITACGSSAKTTTVGEASGSTTTEAARPRAGSIQAAALAWAHAYLTGTPYEVEKLQGPECKGRAKITPQNETVATNELQQVRARVERATGMSTAAIEEKISGVSVRNVTDAAAEAEVRYDLPESITGNDNTVTYERIDGAWKVADCIAPFGGSSSTICSPAPGETVVGGTGPGASVVCQAP